MPRREDMINIVEEEMQCCHVSDKGKRCIRRACTGSDLCLRHGGEIVVEAEMFKRTSFDVDYDADYHGMKMIEIMSDGASLNEVAAAFGISIQKLKKWCEEIEDMFKAYEIAVTACEAWWCNQGRLNINNIRYNNGLYKFHMANRFGWADKVETKGSMDVNHNHGVLLIPGNVDDINEWASRIEERKRIEAK